MIKKMKIENITMVGDYKSSIWVAADILGYYYPSKNVAELSESEFFDLAIQYLSEYGEHIKSLEFCNCEAVK